MPNAAQSRTFALASRVSSMRQAMASRSFALNPSAMAASKRTPSSALRRKRAISGAVSGSARCPSAASADASTTGSSYSSKRPTNSSLDGRCGSGICARMLAACARLIASGVVSHPRRTRTPRTSRPVAVHESRPRTHGRPSGPDRQSTGRTTRVSARRPNRLPRRELPRGGGVKLGARLQERGGELRLVRRVREVLRLQAHRCALFDRHASTALQFAVEEVTRVQLHARLIGGHSQHAPTPDRTTPPPSPATRLRTSARSCDRSRGRWPVADPSCQSALRSQWGW